MEKLGIEVCQVVGILDCRKSLATVEAGRVYETVCCISGLVAVDFIKRFRSLKMDGWVINRFVPRMCVCAQVCVIGLSGCVYIYVLIWNYLYFYWYKVTLLNANFNRFDFSEEDS